MSKETLIVSVGVVAFVILATFVMFGIIPLPTNFIKTVDKTTQSASSVKKPEEKKVRIEDITAGEGKEAKKGDIVVVHYKGLLENGKLFDSSYDRGEPFETQIGVGRVIRGWDDGIPGMKVGGKRKLTIPPEMGYGSQGQGDIPPDATLIFEVELLDIKNYIFFLFLKNRDSKKIYPMINEPATSGKRSISPTTLLLRSSTKTFT